MRAIEALAFCSLFLGRNSLFSNESSDRILQATNGRRGGGLQASITRFSSTRQTRPAQFVSRPQSRPGLNSQAQLRIGNPNVGAIRMVSLANGAQTMSGGVLNINILSPQRASPSRANSNSVASSLAPPPLGSVATTQVLIMSSEQNTKLSPEAEALSKQADDLLSSLGAR